MKPTICPPAHAYGYDDTASVVNGFFVPRYASTYGRFVKMATRISTENADKYGGATGLGDLIAANHWKRIYK